MEFLKLKSGAAALAIVAHPDDETIWMGGFILRQPKLKWTVFSLCRVRDKDRAPKFFRACAYYGARGLMADLDDEGKLDIGDTLPVIERLIGRNIGQTEHDIIFTHGANGEYGHPRHQGVSRTVRKMFKAGALRTPCLLNFAYAKAGAGELSALRADNKADILVKLPKTLFSRKKRIMTDIYGFAPDGIDAGYCTNPEAFIIIK